MNAEPKTPTASIQHYSDPEVALATMIELRWRQGVNFEQSKGIAKHGPDTEQVTLHREVKAA